jgi:hypothetical protein
MVSRVFEDLRKRKAPNNPLVESFPNPETVSPILIHNSWNCSSKFGAVPTLATTPASNYFQSVHCWKNPRVPLHSSRWELCLGAFYSSIQPSICCQSTIFFSAPVNSVFSSEPPPLLSKFFLHFPLYAQPLSLSPLSLFLPGVSPPSSLFSPSAAPL